MNRRKPAIPVAEDKPTLTVEQAAALLGLSRASAYRAAQTGELPTILIGRRVLVLTAELRRKLGLDEPAASKPATAAAASAPRPNGTAAPKPRRRRAPRPTEPTAS